MEGNHDQAHEPPTVPLTSLWSNVSELETVILSVSHIRLIKAPALTGTAHFGARIARDLRSAYAELADLVRAFETAIDDPDTQRVDAYFTVAFAVRSFAADQVLGALREWSQEFLAENVRSEGLLPLDPIRELRRQLLPELFWYAGMTIYDLIAMIEKCADLAGANPDEVAADLRSVIEGLQETKDSMASWPSLARRPTGGQDREPVYVIHWD